MRIRIVLATIVVLNIAAGAVAREQNVAGGIGLAEEGALVGGQAFTGKPKDRGQHGPELTGRRPHESRNLGAT